MFLHQENAKIHKVKRPAKTTRVLGRAVQEVLECRRLLSGYELAAIANFDTTVGTNPQGGVIMDAAGNLYGTAQSGGATGAGSVFELAKGASTITLLASFNGTDGQSPDGRLFRDSNGDLFGTAAAGGANSEGAVFELAKGDSTITILASFNYDNGESPIGGVILDSLGNIYGTTEYGGDSDYGTIFELAKGDSTITTLFSANYADAANPQSELVMDSNGNLYGTSSDGGEFESGAVFEYSPSGGALTILANFGFNSPNDADAPVGGLIMDASGNLYGTTSGYYGGDDELPEGGPSPVVSSDDGADFGTVFELSPGSSVVTTLASFDGGDGNDPVSTLLRDSSGNLFGNVTQNYGEGSGAVFEVVNGSGAITTLANFNGVNGSDPTGSLAMDAAGNIYGAAANDSVNNNGTLFELGLPAKLKFTTQPSTANVNAAITPAVTVSVDDSSGDVIPFDNSTVTLAIASGPSGATLSGTVSEMAVNGVATFSDLSLDKIGSYTLQATDDTLTAATSNSFAITPVPAKLAFGTQPSNTVADATITPAVTVDVEDSSGNLATGDNSTVTLAIATGPGGATLSGTLSEMAVNGVATFNDLSLDKAGAYTLKATDGSLTSATSNSFNITPAPAKLAFGTQPSTAMTGATITPAVTVDVEDSGGSIVTGDNSTVTLAIAPGPGGATLSGTLSEMAVNGVATFSDLSLDKSGAYTLKATDGSLTSTTSNSFNITPTPAKLAFATQPSTAMTGATITPAVAVDVEDSSGTVVTGDDSTVTLAIASGPGGATLSGTLSEMAVNGVATFSDLSLDKAGAYTLKATDGSLTSSTSNSFNITPTPAKLAFATQPSTAMTGATITPAVTVDVEDSSGNVVTGDNSTVTLAIASGPGGATLSGTLSEMAVNGVATFNDLSLDKSGAYTLKATDGSLTSSTSNSFNITPTSAKLAFATQPSTAMTGATITPAVTVDVEDSSGNVVTGDNSTVTLAIASGPGGATLSGTLSGMAVNGVATFSNLSLDIAGAYTLKATDGSLTSTTSNSFNITPTPAKLAYATQPSMAQTGAVISPAVTVDVEDSSGNVVAGDNSTVTLSIASSPPGATITGTVTAMAVNGVATFSNLSFNTAGTYTLKASDGTLTSATSISFTITPAPAQLAFSTQPSTTIAGSIISPAVTVNIDDSSGAVVAGANSTVTLAIASGPAGATLGGTVSVAAVNGVATFSNLSLNVAGAYTLKATDGALTAAISISFNITPAPAKLAFATQPSSEMTGATLNPPVTVNVEDSSGNIVVGDSSTVTLSIASGPAGATLSGTVTAMAVNGVATFSNLSLNKAGAYTLKATDGALTAATSISFTITPTPVKLAFTAPPSGAVAGATISPPVMVSVEDSSGNVVVGDGSTITLAIASGPAGATLGGTLSATAVNGVATFSNLSLNLAGTYMLKATDGTLTAATSINFTITPPAPAPATKLAFASPPSNALAGAILSPAVTVSVEDASGNVATTNTSTVKLAIASGPVGATLGGTVSVAAVNGVATFANLSLNKVGVYTLIATDGALTSTISVSFNITPVPAKLAFATQPSTAIAGAIISPAVTVNVDDASGNVVAGDGSTVTLTIASGPAGAALGGTVSAMAVNGVATFANLSLNNPGVYMLKATDGTLTPATSISFTITPAPAKLAFTTPPSTALAGATISPAVAVSVEDSSGNVVVGDNSTVTLTIASGPAGATLGGTVVATAVNGIATFSNLSLNKPGTYTLKATDGRLTAATSISFVITPAPAKLAFAIQPSTAIAGMTLIPAVTVNVEDPTGILVTGDNSTITLTIASGPPGAILGGTLSATVINGVATFSNLSLNEAGAYILKATDGVLTAAMSISFTITPPPAAPAAALAFAVEPSGAVAGAVISPAVTVSVEDATGNVVAGDNSTITLSIASGPAGATLGGTISAMAVNGVVTFASLSLSQPGVYTLIASDGALTTATSSSFTITPAPAQLAFTTQPSATNTGSIVTPAVTVAVEDASGNVVVGDNSIVTLSIASGPAGATLGGTISAVAVNGVAAFSNLSLGQPGAYTLAASDGALPIATSASFSVTNAFVYPPLAFTTIPVSITPGIALSPAVSVVIEDTSGHVITTDDSTVTLSIASGPAGGIFNGAVSVAAVNGVATFPSLFLNVVGSYTLTATDGTLAPATSGVITVFPSARVGALDPLFGFGGIASNNVGITSVAGVVVEPDGKSIIAGTTGAAGSEAFGITRYNADGSLDTTFGTDGMTQTPFNGNARATAEAFLPDGDILIAGTLTTFANGVANGSEFTLVEYTANGMLDTTFGNGAGYVLTSFSSKAGTLSNDLANAMAIGPDGTIYLGGSSDANGHGLDFAVAAYTPTGSPSPTFGTNGKVLLDIMGGDDSIAGLTLNPKGDLIAAGSEVNPANGLSSVAVAEFLPSGALNTKVGNKGIIVTVVGNVSDAATSAAVDSKGRIVVGGYTGTGSISGGNLSANFLLLRYSPDGKLDRSFGNHGVVITAFSQPAAITRLLIDPDGTIVAGGKTVSSLINFDPNDVEIAIARYTLNGKLDPTFNHTGEAVFSLNGAAVTQSLTSPGGMQEQPDFLQSASLSAFDATSDLMAAFMQLTQSDEGIIASTLGGELLDVGSDGGDTVEAEVVTAGLDLAGTVTTKVPEAVVGGGKGKTSVSISDVGVKLAAGKYSVELFISSTSYLATGSVPFQTFAEKLRLKSGKAKNVHLKFVYPSSLPAGQYYLVATVGTGTTRDLNPANNTSITVSTVLIAPPFVKLAGSALTAPTFTTGKPAVVSFTVMNAGNVQANTPSAVEFFASTDGTLTNAISLATAPIDFRLKPGATHVFRGKLVLPSTLPAGTYKLLALLDPNNVFQDPNAATNFIVSANTFVAE